MSIDDVEVDLEEVSQSQVQLTINLPSATNRELYDEAVARLQKLPSEMDKETLRARGMELVIDQCIDAAIERHDLRSIGPPEMLSDFERLLDSYDPDKTLRFKVVLDLWPAIELSSYTDLDIVAEEVQLDHDEEVERIIAEYRDRLATLEDVEDDREAEPGDVAVMEFKVFQVNEDGTRGAEVPKMAEKSFEVEVNPDRFLPEFVEGIYGMYVDEQRDIRVHFPADYPNKEVAGMETLFRVQLKKLKQKILPDLDDDLAQKISDHSTVDDLKRYLRDMVDKEAAQATELNIENSITERLADVIEVEIPDTLIREETMHSFATAMENMRRQGVKESRLRKISRNRDKFVKFAEEVRPLVSRVIKKNLAIAEIAQREGIEVDKDDVDERLHDVIQHAPKGRDIDEARIRSQVEVALEREQVIKWLRSNNKIQLVPAGSLPEPAHLQFPWPQLDSDSDDDDSDSD